MRYVLVCPDDFLHQLLHGTTVAGDPPLYLVAESGVRTRIARGGEQALSGNLDDPAIYRRAFRTGREAVVVAAPAERLTKILTALRTVAPQTPILVLRDQEESPAALPPGVTTLPISAFGERVLQPELERAALRARVERIRQHFAPAERVLIMMQDDPDPDAIASALALRTLLGRNRASAPIATFGTITRPENRTMCRILDIEVEEIRAWAMDEYDRVAMVDVQPGFFQERLGQVDLVIDHHPEDRTVRALMKDIRPAYGATSTILTEYLRAAEVKISQRLATALLYGIKSDTLHLERGGTRADMEAFASLYLLANHNWLRRIERPELPQEALDVFAHGLARRQLIRGVLFSHLGAVPYVDLIPQFADLCLQVEGVEWSVVSGVVNGEAHISVRNVGYVKSAGDVVRAAFGDLGAAGGHRAMAKAVIRLADWRAELGDATAETVRQGVMERFLRALGGLESAAGNERG
ncbi:MAG: bifunctional oligoribonuclease/PAP phosphatase NrnA [Candidatus Rokubacteria bacterium]|nr:bifunctional oligoribonuclease/PAP phosphatase NrnA [Candidatus Rokubacteria bacterium]